MKKYNLKIVNKQENIELNEDLYDLIAVSLLENFIKEMIENNDLEKEDR